MGDEKMKRPTVYSAAGAMLQSLENTLDSPGGRANFAKLRRAVGRPLSETVDLWPLIYPLMPDEFLSKNGTSAAERAILTALTLYALHQQGESRSVLNRERHSNIGDALKALRSEDSAAMDRRFNALITSDSFEELCHHLRQMIGLLRAKTDATVNYARLAQDLFYFQVGRRETIRLNWARAYYRQNKKETKGDEDHD